MQTHGFRKFFKTTCIKAGMHQLYSEYMMGHRSGLTKSYFKPSDMELLEGNDKATDEISIRVGTLGTISLLLCNKCVNKFEETA